MKKIELVLTEAQITTILRALGELERSQFDKGERSEGTEQVITKIYKSMGVKL